MTRNVTRRHVAPMPLQQEGSPSMGEGDAARKIESGQDGIEGTGAGVDQLEIMVWAPPMTSARAQAGPLQPIAKAGPAQPLIETAQGPVEQQPPYLLVPIVHGAEPEGPRAGDWKDQRRRRW